MVRHTLRLHLLLLLIPAVSSAAASLDTATVVSGLATPWEILWGPDDWIWVTERAGRISRANPRTGEKRLLVQIQAVHEEGESGLLGFALHPDFGRIPYIYTVYTYASAGVIRGRLVRFTYDGTALTRETILLDSIPGDRIHNGSRLLFLPDTTLLVTTGDARVTSHSLNLSSLAGKTLRITADGSRPSDNPFNSLVWSYGHRNAQGLALLPNGSVLSSEHGPSTDDELNLIVRGGNYGWPRVEGFCNSSTERAYCEDNPVVEPLRVWTPTLAVCGIVYYGHSAISQWNNSVLMVNLKESDLRVLSLNESMDGVTGERVFFDNWWGRLRAVCVGPSGEVYLATSNRDGRGTVRAGDDRIIRIRAAGAVGVGRTVAASGRTGGHLVAVHDIRGRRLTSGGYPAQGRISGVHLVVDRASPPAARRIVR